MANGYVGYQGSLNRPLDSQPFAGYTMQQGSGGVHGPQPTTNAAGKLYISSYNTDNSNNRYYPNYNPMQLPYLPGMSFSDNISDINKIESKSTGVNQQATNVFNQAASLLGGRMGSNGQYDIGPLASLYQQAKNIQGMPVNLQTSIGTAQNPLNRNFQGADAVNSALNGGVDYFGRLGLSEGLNNLRAQENASNRALTAQLGRNPANASLIAALQNQNRMRTQLAYNPLMGEAQRGSYERATGNVGLNNQQAQLLNNLLGTEASFNNQAQLSGLEARMAQLQPMLNYIESLTALQGQARGVSSTENVLGGKNFS